MRTIAVAIAIITGLGTAVTPSVSAQSPTENVAASLQQISDSDWLNMLGGELRERLSVKERRVDFEAAAAAGNVRAMAVLAGAYTAGIWGPPDEAKALDFAQKAAVKGDARAIANVGQLLSRTKGREAEARQYFETAVEKGSGLAAAFLADMLSSGKGGPADLSRAVALKRKAAELGVAPAMTSLAFALVNGEGVAKNEAEGASWAERAAGRGNAEAMRLMGILAENGTGMPKDLAVAAGWYAKAAEAGSADAAWLLGQRLQSGNGVPKDLLRAVQLYEKAASAGVTAAAARLGALHGGDVLGTTDYKLAEKWLTQAVDGGDVQSMWLLGALYRDDQAGMANPAKAAALFLRAANAGSLSGMAEYGRMQVLGSGVPKDITAGVAWIRKAAAGGNEDAKLYLTQFQNWDGAARIADGIDAARAAASAGNVAAMRRLAFALVNGEGVPKNETEGAQWAKKAANAGDAASMRLIGFLTENGQGVPKDTAAAASWYRKGAEGGDLIAMRNLAFALVNGEGVPKNETEGAQWALKAANAGDAEAMRLLGIIAIRTDGQIVLGGQSAAYWLLKSQESGSTVEMLDFFLVVDKKLASSTQAKQIDSILQKQCDNGDIKSCGFLANLLDSLTITEIFPNNEKRANALFIISCNGGNGHSCWRYASNMMEIDDRYKAGKSDRIAYEYFKKSIKLGGLSEKQSSIAKVSVVQFEMYGRIRVDDLRR